MTGATKKSLKHRAWQFVGSMFMEKKGDYWAASLHRVLALILFIACLVFWMIGSVVPDAMLYTLWGLLGINGAHKVVGAARNGTAKP